MVNAGDEERRKENRIMLLGINIKMETKKGSGEREKAVRG